MADRPATARRMGWLAIAAALLTIVVFPLLELAREVIGTGWSAVRSVLSSSSGWAPMANTVWTSALATAITLAIATWVAVAVDGMTRRARRWVMAGMVLPLVVPPFVSALSWLAAYGPGGLTDDVLGLAVPGLVGRFGVVVLLVLSALPIAFLLLNASLATRTERDLVRAARVAGATPGEAFRTVTLPLLRPALIAAGAVTFVMSANAFGVPAVLGVPAGFSTTTTRLYRDLVLSAEPAAFDRVLILAAFLVVVTLVVVGVADRWSSGRARLRVEPSGPRGRVRSRSRRSEILIGLFVAVMAVVPLVALVLTAVTKGVGVPPWPANWTLDNFRDAFAAGAGSSFLTSLTLAVAAATLVLGLGALLVALERRRRTGAATAVALAFAVPGSVLAVAVLLAYGPWLRDTLLLILIAYLAKFWVLGHRPIAGSADALSPEVVGAARVSGAGAVATVRTIVAPLLRPALVTAWLVVFLFALHELTISSLLYGPGNETLAVTVLNLRQLGDATVTAAMAVLLTVGVGVVAVPLAVTSRRAGGLM